MRTEYCLDGEMSQCEKDPLRPLSWLQIYTRVEVGATTCATMLDRSSKINLVSKSLVDALQLSTTEHPEPYRLLWQGNFVTIKNQVEVCFRFCGHTDFVLCDVLPQHMSVCTFILGQSRTEKRELQTDKSGTFSWRKFKFVCQG